MPKIVTVGEILVEIMTSKLNQEFLEPGVLVGPYASGAPAIFIDQAARMGASCGIIAKVGNDDFGRLNIERLAKDGADTSRIAVDDKYTTGAAFVTYFDDGSRKFIFHFRESAAGYLNEEDIDEEYIKSAEFLHIMGCSLSASEGLRNAINKAVRIAVRNGVKVSFDPNLRPELLDDKRVREAFSEVLEAASILLTGESEINALTGNKDINTTLEFLKAKGIGTIVLKNGKRGIRVIEGDDEYHVPPFMVEEIDPTGAGDCFDGAFLASLLEGKSVKDSAVIANAAGALSVTRKGPMEGVHFKEEIVRFIEDER